MHGYTSRFVERTDCLQRSETLHRENMDIETRHERLCHCAGVRRDVRLPWCARVLVFYRVWFCTGIVPLCAMRVRSGATRVLVLYFLLHSCSAIRIQSELAL